VWLQYTHACTASPLQCEMHKRSTEVPNEHKVKPKKNQVQLKCNSNKITMLAQGQTQAFKLDSTQANSKNKPNQSNSCKRERRGCQNKCRNYSDYMNLGQRLNIANILQRNRQQVAHTCTHTCICECTHLCTLNKCKPKFSKQNTTTQQGHETEMLQHPGLDQPIQTGATKNRTSE
jgi:hypothetical protein